MKLIFAYGRKYGRIYGRKSFMKLATGRAVKADDPRLKSSGFDSRQSRNIFYACSMDAEV